jgi:hypothetical protein
VLLRDGYFYTRPRRSKITTLVDGPGVEFMALVFICLGALSACIILERCNAPRSVTWAEGCLLITLTVVFLFVR